MGKHKYIETPERMYELFEAYKKETKDNPRIKVDYVGKDGNKVNIPLDICRAPAGALQISGGMVGQYNASITQRLNNLVEKIHNVNIEQPLFGPDPE